jgi:hypothetical protein
MMTDMEILQLADKCGVLAVTKHEWDGKQFNHTDDYLDGDGAALIIFAKQMMAQRLGRIAEKIKSMPLENDTKDSFLIWLKEQA